MHSFLKVNNFKVNPDIVLQLDRAMMNCFASKMQILFLLTDILDLKSSNKIQLIGLKNLIKILKFLDRIDK